MNPSYRRLLETFGTKLTELYHEWPQLKGMLLKHDAQLAEHEGRLVRVEGKVQALETRRSSTPPPASGSELATLYGLDAGSTGSFRISPDTLADMASQWQQIQAEKEGVEHYLETWRKRVLFIVAVATPLVTLLGWALAHLLHW